MICSAGLYILFYSRSLYLGQERGGKGVGSPCAKDMCQLFLIYYFYFISSVPLTLHPSMGQVNRIKWVRICLSFFFFFIEV